MEETFSWLPTTGQNKTKDWEYKREKNGENGRERVESDGGGDDGEVEGKVESMKTTGLPQKMFDPVSEEVEKSHQLTSV